MHCFRSGRGDVENQLYEAVYASLEAVAQADLQSVGIPAISSGVFGFPLAVACRNIIEAITDFCQVPRYRGVAEIHFVDPNDKAVDIFHEELGKIHGANNVKLTATQTAKLPQLRDRTASGKSNVEVANAIQTNVLSKQTRITWES